MNIEKRTKRGRADPSAGAAVEKRNRTGILEKNER